MTFLLVGALIGEFLSGWTGALLGPTAAFNRGTHPDFSLNAANIEHACRRLISQKHPDKLAFRGLP